MLQFSSSFLSRRGSNRLSMESLVHVIAEAKSADALAEELLRAREEVARELATASAPSHVRSLLVRALSIHAHGLAFPRAVIPAIKLSAAADALCRRTGHLVARCLVDPSDAGPLVLLQNTLSRQLASADVAECGGALLAICRVEEAAAGAALAPQLEALLDRTSGRASPLRAKAAAALARCWKVAGVAEGTRTARLRSLLSESSAGVIGAALGMLRDAPAASSLALLPELVQAQSALLKAGADGAWAQAALLARLEATCSPLASADVGWSEEPAGEEPPFALGSSGSDHHVPHRFVLATLEQVLLATLSQPLAGRMGHAVRAAAVGVAATLDAVGDPLLAAAAAALLRMLRAKEADVVHAALKSIRSLAWGPTYPLALALLDEIHAAAHARAADDALLGLALECLALLTKRGGTLPPLSALVDGDGMRAELPPRRRLHAALAQRRRLLALCRGRDEQLHTSTVGFHAHIGDDVTPRALAAVGASLHQRALLLLATPREGVPLRQLAAALAEAELLLTQALVLRDRAGEGARGGGRAALLSDLGVCVAQAGGFAEARGVQARALEEARACGAERLVEQVGERLAALGRSEARLERMVARCAAAVEAAEG